MPKLQDIQVPTEKWGHQGDTFREVLSAWESLGWARLEPSADRFVWWGGREILLHDHPRIENDIPDFRHGLFGNAQHERGRPWIFWGRRPGRLEGHFRTHGRILPRDRDIPSVFMGKIENEIQARNRFQSGIDWAKHVRQFVIVKGFHTPYPFGPGAYLENMSRSRFAILLPGYGPKCNRDIEAVACGAIPIVTPGVCTAYHDRWVEGSHYLRVRVEADIERVYDTPADTLEEIQARNYAWYERNCTMRGALDTTRAIIDGL